VSLLAAPSVREEQLSVVSSRLPVVRLWCRDGNYFDNRRSLHSRLKPLGRDDKAA